MSPFDPTTTRGLSSNSGRYLPSSPRRISSWTSGRPASGPRSSRSSKTRAPFYVSQELVPEAFPSAAPSINPGMSAITKSVSDPDRPVVTTPRCGSRVVNG